MLPQPCVSSLEGRAGGLTPSGRGRSPRRRSRQARACDTPGMARDDEAGVLVELDPETERRLQDVVARTGKGLRELVREAVLKYLEEAEDRALAVERLSTPERRWTLEELERGLNLED